MRKKINLKEITNIRLMADGDGDGSGDGDGGNSNQGMTQAQVDSAISDAVSAATSKLTGKNDELRGELGKAKDLLKGFDGLDAEEVKRTMSAFGQSEDAQLIKEGKFDEVINKRTEKLRGEYDGKLADVSKELETASGVGSKYKKLYEDKIVDDKLREIALKAKVIPEALGDVLRRGREIFSLGEDGSIEARDGNGNLVKDGEHLVTPNLFVENLKKSAPYYWPSSTGTGAAGSGTAGVDLSSEIAKAAADGDVSKYRELRQKQAGKK